MYASVRPPKDPKQTAVLTSDVINEAEQTFKSICNEQGLISQLDIIKLLRSMGMNPTDSDIEVLFDVMKLRDPEKERQERIERDEWLKKERERKQKEKEEREAMKDDKKAKAASSAKKKKEDEKKDQMLWIPPERRPVVDWPTFIRNVEPFFRDNKIEEEALLRALKVFDKEGRGWISRDDLVRILTTKGEDILSPPEVAALLETFPNPRVEHREFAQKMQGTYVEPKVEEAENSSTTSRRAPSQAGSTRPPPTTE
eukprot:RCo033675